MKPKRKEGNMDLLQRFMYEAVLPRDLNLWLPKYERLCLAAGPVASFVRSVDPTRCFSWPCRPNFFETNVSITFHGRSRAPSIGKIRPNRFFSWMSLPSRPHA